MTSQLSTGCNSIPEHDPRRNSMPEHDLRRSPSPRRGHLRVTRLSKETANAESGITLTSDNEGRIIVQETKRFLSNYYRLE